MWKKTFINSAAQECSEIDYFLYQSHSDFNMLEKTVLKNVCSNISDYLPIQICIGCHVVEPITAKTKSSIKKNSVRVKWHKTDIDYYKALVTETIKEMSSEFVLDYTCNLESAILGFIDLLINSTQQTTKTSRRRSTKPTFRSLDPWN